MTIGRTAVLTRPHRGRAACHYCGPCDHGCIYEILFQHSEFHLARSTRHRQIDCPPHSVVHSLIYDSAKATSDWREE